MAVLTLADLDEASEAYQAGEKRGSFYDMSLNLLRAGFEIEGCFLLLATWNFASFRYAVNDCDIDGFKKIMSNLQPDFAALLPFTIQSIDLEAYGPQIKRMFDTLAAMKEVKFTGATKVMQLKCPELFVIWDDYIRGNKPMKAYRDLECVQSGKWAYAYYEKSGSGYLQFLRDMQSKFREIAYPQGDTTLAKAIDEFNYVNVTLPMQEAENDKKARAKAAE